MPPQQYRDRFVQRVIDEVMAGDGGAGDGHAAARSGRTMEQAGTSTGRTNKNSKNKNKNKNVGDAQFHNPGVDVEMENMASSQQQNEQKAKMVDM